MERLLLKQYVYVMGKYFRESLDKLQTDPEKEITFHGMEGYAEFLRCYEMFKDSVCQGDYGKTERFWIIS